jgi:3-hydroxybutyryl-CoA dehydrogenase
MKIAVVTNEQMKAELLAQGLQDTAEVVWLEKPAKVAGAVCYVDLLFNSTAKEIENWISLQPEMVIVNAVETTLQELPKNFVRINGWPGFLKREVVEAACEDEKIRVNTQNIFFLFNKKVEWVADIPGFVSPRVISMIINEAYHTLAEGVSTKEEIDTAMKLGTNYPYGPFEWSKKIGLNNIYKLLQLLSENNSRYQPVDQLTIEANP